MNINTIAKLSGVSKSTVSRVLSKNGSVSKESYDKVMHIINKYNYKPNRYARILNNKPTNLIGIITPDITNPYFPEIIKCITEIATESGYRIILCNTDTKFKSQVDYLNMLKEMQVDGTILLCPSTDLSNLNDYCNMPLVSIDAVINNEIPYVCSDFYKGGFIAGTELIKNDCKHILHISGQGNFYANIHRKRGFAASIEKYNSDNIKTYLLPDISNSTSYEKIKEYLMRNPQIDGIFTDNDSFAFTVLRILNELNISVPDKVKVIGYDDNFMIPMVYPLLSTIHQPISDIGKTAIITLLNLINNQQIKKVNILDVKYIKRNTTII